VVLGLGLVLLAVLVLGVVVVKAVS
jgi:hypothetical protein